MINPFAKAKAAITDEIFWSGVRSVLKFGGGMLVTHGLASQGQSEALTGALVTLLSTGWSMWVRYRSKQVTVTLGAVARMSEDEARALVVDPGVQTPSVRTPSHVVPALA